MSSIEAREIIDNLLQQNNGLLLTASAERAGLSRTMLSRLVDDGVLERTERGVYVAAGEMQDQLFSLQQQALKIVFSHETALFLHGMTDRTPFRYSVTVPNNYNPSEKLRGACVVRYCNAALYPIGQTMLPTGMGHSVCCYDLERTVCDVLRARNKMDVQIFTDALKRYAADKQKNLHRLADYAAQFRVEKLLRQYLEVLL